MSRPPEGTPPLVSVIIPTYNRAHLLSRAVRSAQAQTYHPLEVIVVDDASVDETPSVIESLDDGRLRYVRHDTNRGGSAARNTGLAAARGAYVAFLDADDEWLPEKLGRQIEALCSQGAGLSYTRYAIYRDGRKQAEQPPPHSAAPPSTRDALLLKNTVGTTSTVVVERDALRAIDGFDETLPSCQDWDAWLRLAGRIRFAYVPKTLTRYHFHTANHQITSDGRAVIKGHEAMLRKYRGEIEALGPSGLAHHYLRLGEHCCHFRAIRRARRYLLRAILLAPSTWKAYPLLAASLGGKRVFNALAFARRKLPIDARLFGT